MYRKFLFEFNSNIKSYGGIQALFKALNETSPEYADKLDAMYAKAIDEALADGSIEDVQRYQRVRTETDTKEAVHILGHIYGMLQYAQLHDNVIEDMPDEAMIYILEKLHSIIRFLERSVNVNEN